MGHSKMPILSCLILLCSAGLLSGCATVALSAATEGMVVAADKQRSAGDVVNDSGTYAEIQNRFFNADVHDLLMNVGVTVRKNRVLLTGVVLKTETAQKAAELAWQVAGVEEVINEIEISPDGKKPSKVSDEWIEKQVELRLTVTKNVNVFNFSIEASNGTIFLLGLVLDEAEHERVLQVVRTTSGVRRVVSHLRIPGQVAPTTQRGY